MKPNIATANSLTRGQESAVLIKIAEQLGIEDIQKAVEMFLRGTAEIVVNKIFDWVGVTTTSATTEKFIAREKFRTSSKEVKFYGFGDNFPDWFLAGDGKIEESLGEQRLRYGNLIRGARDLPEKEGDIAIIPELGGEAKAETTLTELYDLLKRQANGEDDGVLLTNGRANIFYIRDIEGLLRAVFVHWLGVGWHVCALSVGHPFDWPAGSRVFSRNPRVSVP